MSYTLTVPKSYQNIYFIFYIYNLNLNKLNHPSNDRPHLLGRIFDYTGNILAW